MNHIIVISIIASSYFLSRWFIKKYITNNEIVIFVFSYMFTSLIIIIFGAYLYYFGATK